MPTAKEPSAKTSALAVALELRALSERLVRRARKRHHRLDAENIAYAASRAAVELAAEAKR